MKNLKKLWAMGVGAIFGFAMYEAGRQDGEEEGLEIGYISGAIETIEAIKTMTGDEPEVD